MRHVLGGLLWVLLLAPSLVCCQTCIYNDTVLTGSNFELAGIVTSVDCGMDVPLFQQQGALYSLPELRVVANTTVTFNITSTVSILAFGLTLSPSSVTVSSGDALGLTPTTDSVSAGACRMFPEPLMLNNTFAHNSSAPGGGSRYTAQPCVLTWQVPFPNINYNYSYFVHDSTYTTPSRRIHIVNSTDVPSSSSSSAAASSSSGAVSSSSSSSSAAPGPSSSSSASSSGSARPGSSSSSGTGTGSSIPTLGPGSSSSNSGTGTGTGSSPSLSSSSIGTSSSSSSSSSPNGACARVNAVYGAVAVVVAVIFTMVSA